MKRTLKPNGFVFITVLNFKYVSNKNTKQIAPRTFILLRGYDIGVPHYQFNKNILRKEFKNFKILDLWNESLGSHYCLLGQLKKK